MHSESAIIDSVAVSPALVLRLRLVQGKLVILGPGKVELMKLIAETGSISEAAKTMGMSYNRAWLHVKVLNSAFREPLVLSLRGGSTGGGASLSPVGRRLITIYDRAVRSAMKAANDAGREFRSFFKK